MGLTLILGAGCTLSDATSLSRSKRPPLDHGFFGDAKRSYPREVRSIEKYIKENYGYSILSTSFDSLEGAMTKIYADILDPMLQDDAVSNFRNLIRVFNNRIAETTNDIRITTRQNLYTILSRALKNGFKPEEITIITFNQDIQAEKTLHKIQSVRTYGPYGKIFNFPYCYGIDVSPSNITSPRGASTNLFEVGSSSGPKGITILKLHGSLNWYSTHRSSKVRPKVLFNPNRSVRITRRKSINPNLSLKGKKTQYTFPIVVPPVTNKSSILHNKIRPLWTKAEESLSQAEYIIVFGYSCPPSDFESMNLLQRSIRGRTNIRELVVINPDTEIVKRYADIIDPKELLYYRWPRDYIRL